MRPVAVVFDWGGTLAPIVSTDLVDMWRAAARVIAPGRVEPVAASLVAAERDWWLTAVETGRSGTTADVFAAVGRATGLDVGAAVQEAAMREHLAAWTPHTAADPSAAPLLAALRARGLRLGLLSNTHWPRAWHEGWLERDGLLEALDARVYTSDLEWIKPRPEAFLTVLGLLGVADPRSAVFVGDRMHDDIWGAQQLGMRTVHLPNDVVPRYDVTPDATIPTLADLLPLVDAWLAED